MQETTDNFASDQIIKNDEECDCDDEECDDDCECDDEECDDDCECTCELCDGDACDICDKCEKYLCSDCLNDNCNYCEWDSYGFLDILKSFVECVLGDDCGNIYSTIFQSECEFHCDDCNDQVFTTCDKCNYRLCINCSKDYEKCFNCNKFICNNCSLHCINNCCKDCYDDFLCKYQFALKYIDILPDIKYEICKYLNIKQFKIIQEFIYCYNQSTILYDRFVKDFKDCDGPLRKYKPDYFNDINKYIYHLYNKILDFSPKVPKENKVLIINSTKLYF